MQIRIGDIVEIETPVGLAYALYTHHDVEFGAMLRVFDELHAKRPRVPEEVLMHEVRFSTFYPLRAALREGLVRIAGNAPVPDCLRTFPLFRAAGLVDPTRRRVQDWWLWDGQKEWRVGRLTPEQRKLPIRAVWNHTYLFDRIVDGWRPDTDPR